METFSSSIPSGLSPGLPQFNATLNESLSVQGCNPNGSFAIVVHGWLEGWRTEWVQDLVSNLTVYRGGCIIVMDYSNFSTNANYFALVPQFNDISDVLLRFLEKLDEEEFDFEANGYMFGFSYGAHLAIHTARRFGAKRFKEIDGKQVWKFSDRNFLMRNILHFYCFSLRSR